MEHIKLFDWCSSAPDIHFINEADVDNSVTERILRNKFHDPLISSDSEDESKPKEKINWDEIFKKKNEKNPRVLVPGFHNPPPFQKLSALTAQQHLQCLKVLCASKPHILPAQFMGRPTKQDYRVFEELKEAYAKEQQEFIDWAKSLWASSHCVRALRPKPTIEMVYEAEFKVTAHKMQSFPKNYAVAAQIPLENENVFCEMVAEKELINVNISNVPKIKVPDMLSKFFIMNNTYPVPEPCTKHPCRFKLPNESTMTVLPLTEVHRELAQYAADHGSCNIASEEALRCLVELDRSWLLAVSVCQVLTQDGPTNVVVLDCEFAVRRESALVRTYKALRRLLAHALVPPNLAAEKRARSDNRSTPKRSRASDHEEESSDDDDNLYIDEDYVYDLNEAKEADLEKKKANEILSKERRNSLRGGSNRLEFYNCTCRDSFDKPASRSFRKWKVMNRTACDRVNLIVHCPHSSKGDSGEVVLEPIPEYQADVGGSAQSPHAARGLALAMLLRKNASVLNVRIDGPTGEIVTLEPVSKEELVKQHPGIMAEVSNKMYATFDQLQGLLPGHYVLQHEPFHGANALLCRAQAGAAGAAVRLQFACAPLAEADEAGSLRAPPALAPVLLPIHKYRRYLPCAFPPFPHLVAREKRRAPPPLKPPPQAIKWPKKKRGRNKKNNNDNN